MSVIVSRALPEIDGFKPSHRKLLYTMYKMGLLKGARTKSANVVGQTMKLNPHGDMAIYETMVRLTKGHDALLHSYVDSKGNFGKVSSRDMKYAASRYTEVKLAKICQELFRNIEKNTVDFVDNYDGQLKEPLLLPTTFPNVLVNANKGIAVGMASSIASFNLAEVAAYTIAVLKGENVNPLDIIKAPDFSTGGYLIYDRAALESIYQNGTGSVRLRAKYTIDTKNKLIEIHEIPYSTTVEAIIDKIIDAIKAGKIKEISDVRDETDLSGLKITIDLKRGVDAEVLMQKLFKITPLEDSFSCNFNILIDGKPKVLGIATIIDEWIKYRLNCIQRQLNYELNVLESRLHLLLALKKVLLDIDLAIKIIRDTDDDAGVVPNLMQAFAIDEKQAEFVAEIKLRHLNKNYLLNKIAEIEELEKNIAKNQKLLSSEKALKGLIIEDLERVSKEFGQERKTEILEEHVAVTLAEEDLVEDYNLKLFLTEHGYFKKISLTSLRAYSEHKTKDDDKIVQEVEATNLSEILFFTDKQNVYKIKAYEITDHKASELGAYLQNILDLEADEKVLYFHATTDYSGHLLFAYQNGKMAKVPLSSYEMKQNRKKLLKAYSDKAPLLSIEFCQQDREVFICRTDKAGEKTLLVFNSALVPEKVTKSTQGIQVIRLKKGAFASSAGAVEKLNMADYSKFVVDSVPMAGTKIGPKHNFANPWL